MFDGIPLIVDPHAPPNTVIVIDPETHLRLRRELEYDMRFVDITSAQDNFRQYLMGKLWQPAAMTDCRPVFADWDEVYQADRVGTEWWDER